MHKATSAQHKTLHAPFQTFFECRSSKKLILTFMKPAATQEINLRIYIEASVRQLITSSTHLTSFDFADECRCDVKVPIGKHSMILGHGPGARVAITASYQAWTNLLDTVDVDSRGNFQFCVGSGCQWEDWISQLEAGARLIWMGFRSLALSKLRRRLKSFLRLSVCKRPVSDFFSMSNVRLWLLWNVPWP